MGGAGGKPPRGKYPLRPPPSSDSSSSKNSDHSSRYPRRDHGRTPPREQDVHLPNDEEIIGMIQSSVARAIPAKRIPRRSPESYDGSEKVRVKDWLLTVRTYLTYHRASFENDADKIMWVEGLMKEKALHWHQQRFRLMEETHQEDTWAAYLSAFEARFRKSSQEADDRREIQALTYKGDGEEYLSTFADLNRTVGLTGGIMREIIMRNMPEEIPDLIHNRHGRIPEVDVDFIEAVRDACLILEEKRRFRKMMKERETPSEKKVPKMEDRSQKNSGKGEKPKERQGSGTRDAPPKNRKVREENYRPTGEALKGIPQEIINRHKRTGVKCWRCGRDNHITNKCYARKTAEGEDLPEVGKGPSATAATSNQGKRKRGAEESERPKKTQATTAAVVEKERDEPIPEAAPIWAQDAEDTEMEDF